MTDISVFTQPFLAEDLSWDLTPSEGAFVIGGTLLVAAFDATTHYPNGYIPSGTVLGQRTSDSLWGPYSGSYNESQSVTEGGSGLTSFTLTWNGQTTTSIPAASTAATVQAALAALSNIGAGNVSVTGSTSGPYSVTFIGALSNTDVAQMTATPTGGSGTVTVATTQAGAADDSSDGLQVAIGLLRASIQVLRPTGAAIAKIGAPCLVHGVVSKSHLPYTDATAPLGGYLDANAQTDLKLIYFQA